MKKSIYSIFLAGSLSAALLLSACGSTASSAAPEGSSLSSPATELISIKVGASPAPHAEILEVVKPLLSEQGIELEIIEFSDYVVPNTALNEGELDANYFQHQPYLNDFNDNNGTTLLGAASIHFEPLGIYPGKIDTLEDLPDGALVGIPNDATNEARALYLLEAQGLITLADVGFTATPANILDNPKNLQFAELEAAQLPASLPDLAIAVINGNYAVEAGLAEHVLATEGSDSVSAQTYANIVAVRSGDEARPEIKALIAALQSDDVRSFIEEKYAGVVVPVF